MFEIDRDYEEWRDWYEKEVDDEEEESYHRHLINSQQ
jgi:hypothetical protein